MTLPMMEQLAEEIARHLERGLGIPSFGDPRFAAHDLKEENFHEVQPSRQAHRVAFVDGGQQPIFSSPSLALWLQRVAYVLYEGDRSLPSQELKQRVDYYALALAEPGEEDELEFQVYLYPVDIETAHLLPEEAHLRFSSKDRSLAWGYHRVEIGMVLDTVRLYAEWTLARAVAEHELTDGDVVVRDGTLQTGRTNEGIYATAAYDAALKNGVLFGALSKSSTLFTSTGLPLLSAIGGLAHRVPYSTWYYHPIVDITHPDHRGDMYAVQFHSRAEYIFRFEILREQAENGTGLVGDLLATLAQNSRDIRFPGYPFGLIDADRVARVRQWEAGPHITRFLSEASRLDILDRLNDFRRTVDAHSRLDEVILGG
ncbi:MAG: DNA double-strand break repair nuclease NurA [Thermoplasmata archaeon]